MKTTIDLPEDLVRELKFRAVRDRRKFKEVAAELLRFGLAIDAQKKPAKEPRIIKNKKTGLLMIDTGNTPAPHQPTPEQITDILLAQEMEWFRGAS